MLLQMADDQERRMRSLVKTQNDKEFRKEQRSRRRDERRGIRRERRERVTLLASRGKSGFFNVFFSRFGLIILMIIFQALAMMTIWSFFEELIGNYILVVQTFFEIIVIIALINRPMDNSAKLSWLLLITLIPLAGTLFYVWTSIEMGYGTIKKRLTKITNDSSKLMVQSDAAMKKMESINFESAALGKYLEQYDSTAVFENVSVKYFPLGQDKFLRMLEELEKAEKFIFLEYFIVEEGYMWGRILDVLERKAKSGVEIRVMYDGTCEFSKLPHDYSKRLKNIGIQCRVWERIKPVITSSYNYRDHRKILVIDGKTAFCGGVNLADEYINRVEKFGHWKDTAIMLRGSAVDSFTLMFLQMWNVKTPAKNMEDFSQYFNRYDKSIRAEGCIIPYAESPLNNHKIAERVYTDILYSAKKYVYIMTPYLILDGELTAALRFAAERGVDVKMILPGIPDKKAVWLLAKNQYSYLMEAGVKIYEYVPGFVHSKIFLSDDIKAVVGTINLDYRSLYHHFECAAYMAGTPCIDDIHKDFDKTFEYCELITPEKIKSESILTKLIGAVMRIIAPLL